MASGHTDQTRRGGNMLPVGEPDERSPPCNSIGLLIPLVLMAPKRSSRTEMVKKSVQVKTEPSQESVRVKVERVKKSVRAKTEPVRKSARVTAQSAIPSGSVKKEPAKKTVRAKAEQVKKTSQVKEKPAKESKSVKREETVPAEKAPAKKAARATGRKPATQSVRPKMTKWQVAQVWRAYQNREGPQNLGAVEWPKPKPGCLKGVKILSTGVFETIEREDMISLLTDCGAHYYSGMSPNLHYLLVGRDAGPVKLQVAAERGIPQLSEAEFFKWITDKTSKHAADKCK